MYGTEDNPTSTDQITIEVLSGAVDSVNFEKASASCGIAAEEAQTVEDFERALQPLDRMIAEHCREVGNVVTAELLES